MHRTPDPENEPPYEPADPPPAHFAEQALLGAVLLDPGLLPTLEQLGPAVFAHPAHAAVFAAMRTVPAPASPTARTGLDWLNAVLAKARRQAPGLTPSYMHTLISACPRPHHAPAYAAILRSEHARRTLRLHAERLAQAATDTTVPDRPQHALDAADVLARHLDELAEHFPTHPRPLPRTPPPQAAPDDTDEGREAEQWLLACAVSHPDHARLMGWLTADDFLHPGHAGLWQCVTTLAHRGDPVDPVTVLWEAQHRGLLAAGLTPADTLALLSTPVGSAGYWGERLVERTLLARALQAARHVTAYAADPANSVHQLVTGSRRALADLHAVRSRWCRATHPADPSTIPAAGPAAPRAGPRTPLTTQAAPLPSPPRRPTAVRIP
ncbi:DnaB-like helicase N-terminal domain-containing protein [Streptomyces sp. NPDC048577]|uniref:DnaB-like helicase N-terminal domain-containing protein n=1 Tax=Streptomyces sp. NPDC048577 TaxID=3157209 RepID=UPI0034171175